jgi:translation elongation factor EF-Tu-like GTPase
MFSIAVEEAFFITGRKGITLFGRTSGTVKIGDYLVEIADRRLSFKVIGIEMVHFTNIDKELSHNPAIMIETDITQPSELKGKFLESL